MQVQLSHPARTVEVKGPKKVKELLRELNLPVEAHLVIKGDDLVTEDEMLYDGDQIEIRPVISGGSPLHASPLTLHGLQMNCTKCKTKAVIGLPRHNAAFCKGCFNVFVHDQVARAIKSEKMFGKEERILVAVSGGKDSLALWDILPQARLSRRRALCGSRHRGYSEQSHAKVTKFAEAAAASHGATLHLHTVEQEAGAGIKELAQLIHRPTCSTCGTIKRYQFNRVAVEQDYDVMATGHNLDDEAARLLGNVLHWQEGIFGEAGPVVAGIDGRFCQESEASLSAFGTRTRSVCGLEPDRLHRRGMPHGQGRQDASV